MTARTPQPLSPYSVKINTATGTGATLPITLLTPKQAEELQVEFKKIAHDAGVRGARISVQRLSVDDYDKVLHVPRHACGKQCPKLHKQYWGYDLRELGERALEFLCKDQGPWSLKWSSRALNGGDPNHNSP